MKTKNQNRPFSDDSIQRIAQDVFNIPYLFPWQRLVIANILDAEKTDESEDSAERGKQIVLLPTGAGKSLCFLVPALVLKGASLVIYPLLALMQDQKRRIDECGILSVTFRGGMTEEEREENFRKIKMGAKIIIANPEVLQNENLLERLSECNISHIAIDEAHCVSEWGDSFRPAYLTLGSIIKKLKCPLVTAFTATASSHVLTRIEEVLFNGKARILRSESDRPNITYSVYNANVKTQAAIYFAKSEKLPAIFFCGTRLGTENLSKELNLYFGKDKAKFYHAGMTKAEKEKIEKWFFEKTDAILCATCAYGMGVDKKNIRTVIHIDPPFTAEQYIQEAGRGGRDGKHSKAILLWSEKDSQKFSKFKKDSREYSMKEFAESNLCRRQILLDALGAEKTVCSGCDVCNYTEKTPYFDDGKVALDFIRHNKKLYKKIELEEQLMKILNAQAKKHGIKNTWEHSSCAELIENLECAKKIRTCKKLWKGRVTISPSP